MKNTLFEDLLNDLIHWGHLKEDIWKYHPDNPERVDIVDEYNRISEKFEQIKSLLKQIKIDKYA